MVSFAFPSQEVPRGLSRRSRALPAARPEGYQRLTGLIQQIAHDPARQFPHLLRTLRQMLEADEVALWWSHPDGTLRAHFCSCEKEGRPGVCARCPVRRDHPPAPLTAREQEHPAQSVLRERGRRTVLPLQYGPQRLGMLAAVRRGTRSCFDASSQELCAFLGSLLGMHLHMLRLEEREPQPSAPVVAGASAPAGMQLSSISHGVKNILGQIEGSRSLMQRGIDTQNWNLLEVSWPIFLRSGAKLGRLVRQLLGQAPSSAASPVAFGLNELVREIAEESQPRAHAAGIQLEIVEAADLPPLAMDRVALEHVISNLVANAIEALQESPVADRRIVLRTQATATGQAVQISDNGPGIPPGLRPLIFEPFFTTKAEGNGMGLAIVRACLEQIGGHMELAEYRLGHAGCTWDLTLPAAPASRPLNSPAHTMRLAVQGR